MQSVIQKIEAGYKKKAVVSPRSGDTVRVSQKVREGNKERIQIFEGTVIKVTKPASHDSRITVRRIASGVGVEKSFLIHSSLVVKIQITKRGKVRRNYLSYIRELTGKSSRLVGQEFDRESVNAIVDTEAEAEAAKLAEEAAKLHEAEAAKKAEAEAKAEAKAQAALKKHEETKK